MLPQLEAHRPQTFGGLAGSIDRRACKAGLARFRGEVDFSVSCMLLVGATWTAARAGGQGMRPHLLCPYCPKGAAETEYHVLWECPRWDDAKDPWLLLVMACAAHVPLLGPVAWWPVCLSRTCLPYPSQRGLLVPHIAQAWTLGVWFAQT